MNIISTKKPEYNNRSYESYIKNGFADNIPRSIRGPYDRMQKFLSQCDLRKGPIERTPDWKSSTKKNERKEFIYYEEDWTGYNWLGIPINRFHCLRLVRPLLLT